MHFHRNCVTVIDRNCRRWASHRSTRPPRAPGPRREKPLPMGCCPWDRRLDRGTPLSRSYPQEPESRTSSTKKLYAHPADPSSRLSGQFQYCDFHMIFESDRHFSNLAARTSFLDRPQILFWRQIRAIAGFSKAWILAEIFAGPLSRPKPNRTAPTISGGYPASPAYPGHFSRRRYPQQTAPSPAYRNHDRLRHRRPPA